MEQESGGGTLEAEQAFQEWQAKRQRMLDLHVEAVWRDENSRRIWREADERTTVMRDPDGNAFCVVQT